MTCSLTNGLHLFSSNGQSMTEAKLKPRISYFNTSHTTEQGLSALYTKRLPFSLFRLICLGSLRLGHTLTPLYAKVLSGF